MKRLLLAGIGLFAASLFATSLLPAAGHAEGTIKIGLILPYSGQFADTATQIDDGIKLYMQAARRQASPARRSRSSARTSAASTRRSPSGWRRNWWRATRSTSWPACCSPRTRLPAASVSARSEEIHGGHERGDLDHHRQVALLHAHLVHRCRGQRQRSATGRPRTASRTPTRWSSDYGPGIDAETGFIPAGFKAGGGKIVGSVRMAVAEPGLLRLCAARQGSQPAVRSSSSSPAARSRRPSARRWPSAASTRRRSR